MKKRMLSMLLALMTALSLAVVPAGAAGVPDVFQGIAYYGDECNMTAEQARAFAEVIRSEEAKREQEAKQYAAEHGDAYSDYAFDNQVAFADAGGGVPVMLLFSRVNDFGMPVDGDDSLWQWKDGRVKRFLPVTGDYPTYYLYSDHVLVSGIESAVYPFENGIISEAPTTTAAAHYNENNGYFEVDDYKIDGKSVSESQYETWMAQYGASNAETNALAGCFGVLYSGHYETWGMTPTSQVLAALDAYAASAPGAEPTVAGFSDVKESAWYAADVADIQKYGLINGHPDGPFRPQEKLTLAQAITLAARTHALLNGGAEIKNGSPWYLPYVTYADANVICQTGEFGSDYNAECSRLAMAVLFQRAFPTDTEQVLNNITTLPDVEDEGYGSSVFYLYRQGVLTGNDSAGTFKPDKSVSRAEAAAILNRVMDAEKRKSFSLEG